MEVELLVPGVKKVRLRERLQERTTDVDDCYLMNDHAESVCKALIYVIILNLVTFLNTVFRSPLVIFNIDSVGLLLSMSVHEVDRILLIR